MAVLGSRGILKLANGHLLSHLSFSRGTRSSDTTATSSLLLEDLPELQALVGSSSGQHLAIGAQAAVEDTALVSGDLNGADQGRVTPDAK